MTEEASIASIEAGTEDRAKMSESSVGDAKDGDRILAASRRPDGTLRKPVRIRAGYTPQDEVALYQSKAVVFKQGMPAVPPGYDPEDANTKPKTKAAKKNEKRKEKKQLAASALQPSENSVSSVDSRDGEGQKETPTTGTSESESSKGVSGVAEQMNVLSVSQGSHGSSEGVQDENNQSKDDIAKRIRALSKKIRLAEALQASSSTGNLTPEQKEKLSKLGDWRKELRELEAMAGKT